ncbi:motility protein A [Desulfovibrio cuneatus]|uniref:motility protein A n=1 Tax=Desulfovibrio cuneatus TaxID=159728 RepID=UPI0003FC10B2|nr:MotA/TolQ/ExbB proton channel family protein [Desulfovibrio cuneatus]
MDLATPLGLVVSFGLITAALLDGAGGLGLFIHGPSMLIVLGGTIGATLTHYPLGTVLSTGKIIGKTFSSSLPTTDDVIAQFIDYANRARREGILALESIVNGIDNAYVKKGLQLTVDGMEPEIIRSILEAEISNVEARHETGIDLLSALAAYAPALGMIGTVIGLVQMLKNMNDPSSIGPAMAVALITTFYGAVLANLVFLPMVGKLKCRSKEEVLIMEMQLEGIVGISKGENPRIILEKLTSFQPYYRRKKA